MARKDVLLGLASPAPERDKESVSSAYAMRGATKSMLSSIGELSAQAARAEKLLEGASVVDLDTDLVDTSFVSDRMDGNDEAYTELLIAIRERGQDTPILVRPHPNDENRYMVVFGHRRLRVARELGRTVKAVIRKLDDSLHVIAQGQENSARDNLSFIERAVFAQKLADLGYDREIVQAALSTDNPMLTRMLSVTKRVSQKVIDAIGSAKNIGRDRWISFSTLYEKAQGGALEELISTAEFTGIENSNDRFGIAYDHLKVANKTAPKKLKLSTPAKSWSSADKSVTFSINKKPKKVDFSIKSENADAFGDWLSERLEKFYVEFKQTEMKNGE
ncbi:plasmid partitioning protein RepB [Brucella anthropi]|uniref:plasmid partitioning protein RepB n=2 Tax=Bacteria TaxID=2 RepID=UPI000CFACB14|nr:plasmid partitioning protein RepB [Ochrobactrum sp. MYb49]PQZ61822.1 plasmid partitioning protein RepB [Ochrobactrum sp. MYb49]